MSEYAEAMAAEYTEIMSFVRAAVADGPEDENGDNEALALWKQVHGSATMEGESDRDIAIELGKMIGRKRDAAGMLIAIAARRIAGAEGTPFQTVLVELEQEAIAELDSDG